MVITKISNRFDVYVSSTGSGTTCGLHFALVYPCCHYISLLSLCTSLYPILYPCCHSQAFCIPCCIPVVILEFSVSHALSLLSFERMWDTCTAGFLLGTVIQLMINESLKKDNRRVWMIYANAVHRELIEKTMKVISVEDFNILEFDFVVYQVELHSEYKNNENE